MMKSYLLVYNEKVASDKEMTAHIDEVREIVNWRIDMPYTMVLVSELSALEISSHVKRLKEKKGVTDGGFFLVTEIAQNRQGWLPKKTWRLITDKALPGQD
jgi:hypothetical protein